MAIFRRRTSKTPPDALAGVVQPGAVPARYRAVVDDAVRARAQFMSLVDSTPPGPLRQRLTDLAADVDAGVLAVWDVVQHAVRIDGVVSTLDAERATDDLKRARRDGADQTTIDALTERFASNQRLLNALDETRQRLPLLETRLATAVTRAAELVLTSSLASARGLDQIHDDLTRLTQDLEALRLASHELS